MNFYQKFIYNTSYYSCYFWRKLNNYVPLKKMWSYNYEYIRRAFSTKKLSIDMKNPQIDAIFFRSRKNLNEKITLPHSTPLSKIANLIRQKIKSSEEKDVKEEKKSDKTIQVGDILEIHYRISLETKQDFNCQQYKIAYSIPKKNFSVPEDIPFPPYSNQQIEEFQKNVFGPPCIIYAYSSPKEKDVTKECRQWVGPFLNFYRGIKNVYIPVKLLIPPENTLCITNSDGDDFHFSKEQLDWRLGKKVKFGEEKGDIF